MSGELWNQNFGFGTSKPQSAAHAVHAAHAAHAAGARTYQKPPQSSVLSSGPTTKLPRCPTTPVPKLRCKKRTHGCFPPPPCQLLPLLVSRGPISDAQAGFGASHETRSWTSDSKCPALTRLGRIKADQKGVWSSGSATQRPASARMPSLARHPEHCAVGAEQLTKDLVKEHLHSLSNGLVWLRILHLPEQRN